MVACRRFRVLPQALPVSALPASLLQDGRPSSGRVHSGVLSIWGLLAPKKPHACHAHISRRLLPSGNCATFRRLPSTAFTSDFRQSFGSGSIGGQHQSHKANQKKVSAEYQDYGRGPDATCQAILHDFKTLSDCMFDLLLEFV